MPHSPHSKLLESDTLDQPKSTPIAPPTTNSDPDTWFYTTHELLDALPRVWTRGLLYLLVAFTTIALPWLLLAKVDETGNARGRLEPKGRTVRLDAPVEGTVAAIKIKEGQQVTVGQTLVELESKVTQADLQQAEAKRQGQLNRLTQLEVIKSQLEVGTQTQRLQNQAQASAQLAQIRQNRQQLSFNQAAATLSQELLEKDQDRVKRFTQLRQEGVISGLQVEDAERAMLGNKERLKKYQSDIEQSQSELEKQQSAYEKSLREGDLTLIESAKRTQELETQITDVKAEIAQLNKQIQVLNFQLQQRMIQAPIAGTIFQSPIKSAGTVVRSGSLVAQIAPNNTPLVLRAEMTSQESGFLRVGMPVKLKFDAYPFQDYGVIEGRLNWISPDSKVKETNQGPIEIFELEVGLDQPYIQTPTRQIALTPGQTASAEVIVRQRRIIDFMLDPFKKLQKGGLNL